MKKIINLLLAALLVCSLAPTASAQYATIPDVNFRAFLQQNYPTCFNTQGLMDTTCAGVVNATVMNCSNSNIADIEGIQYFRGLDSLNCYSNQLTSLNVQGLTNLHYLSCDNNLLTSLNVQGLTNLQYLSCGNNLLISLNVQGLTNLQTLFCNSNKLTNLSLQVLTNLINLNCGLNQLTSINLQGLTNLDWLYCSNNSLTSMYLQGSMNLNALYCNQNQLTSLDLQGLNNLVEADCTNNQLTSLNLQGLTSLAWLFCDNNPITCIDILPPNLTAFHTANTNITCLPNIPQGITAANTLPLCQPNNINGCFSAARIYGKVEKAINCTGTGAFLPNFLVTATDASTQQVFVGNANTAGDYEIAVPLGSYTLSIVPPNAYWSGCTNTAAIHITQQAQQENRNVLLNAVVACADMEVLHEVVGIMRPCTTAVYRINYFNAGTISAIGTYIELQLAPELIFVSATLPAANITNLGNNRFRILLDTVAALQRRSFDVNVTTACTLTLGQTVCTDVRILPRTYCNPPTLWDGSDVEVSGRCVSNGQARFTIRNTGTGPMTTAQTYTIIEDNVMIRSGQVQLAVNGSDSVTIATDPTRVYRITINETPYNPAGNTQETFLVWGCNGSTQGLHWGFVNQFALNSGADDGHRICTEVRTSFDPNDISATPEGAGTQHFIGTNDLLSYKIRFQNTGNDTAFVVRVLDKISNNLDLTTFKIGTASHPFTYQIKNNGTIEFLFQNILLPDSTTNEAKSHGFVTYSIKPKPNRAEGEIIENQAFIYFDVNAPVPTNIYTHTITYNRLFVSTETLVNGNFAVTVVPNPVSDILNFQTTANLEKCEIFDAVGRLAQTSGVQSQSVNVSSLPQGSYFIKLYTAAGFVVRRFVKM